MDPATLALISAIVTLLITYEPEIAAIGKNIMLLIQKGNNLSPEDIKQIQDYTDEISAKLDKAIKERLEKDA